MTINKSTHTKLIRIVKSHTPLCLAICLILCGCIQRSRQMAAILDEADAHLSLDKQRWQFWLALAFIALLGVAATNFVVYFLYKQRNEKREFARLYKQTSEELLEAKRVSHLLRQAMAKKDVTKRQLEEKEEQVQQLEKVVSELQRQIWTSKDFILHQQLSEAAIIQKLHEIASPYIKDKELGAAKARAATQEEWTVLEETLMAIHPHFFLFLQKHKLSDLKAKVCILSYLGYNNTEIATLSGANQGSITNARTAIARDLFNLSSARELNRYLNELGTSK